MSTGNGLKNLYIPRADANDPGTRPYSTNVPFWECRHS